MPTQPQSPFRLRMGLACASALMLVLAGCGSLGGPGDQREVIFSGDRLLESHELTFDETGTDEAGADDQPDPETDDIDAQTTYCEPAEEGYDALGTMLDATDRKSHETGKPDNSGDTAVMNQAGTEMLAGMDQVEVLWGQAQDALRELDLPATGSTPSSANTVTAYDGYFEYLERLARPEAQIAAEANSIEEYSAATTGILGLEDSLALLIQHAESLNAILEFNLEHCGINRPPGIEEL